MQACEQTKGKLRRVVPTYAQRDRTTAPLLSPGPPKKAKLVEHYNEKVGRALISGPSLSWPVPFRQDLDDLVP